MPVRPDGKVTTPLVDDLPALGKTPTQLARDLEKALGKYIREPVVTVIVTTFVGPTQRADPRHRRSDEAADTRVPQEHDAARRDDRGRRTHRLRRRQQGAASLASPMAESRTACACSDLVKRGDISANVDMRPGDILIIPQSWF